MRRFMKVSVFIDFLRAVTAQRSISFEEAVKFAADLGIMRVDVQEGGLDFAVQQMPLLESYGVSVGSGIMPMKEILTDLKESGFDGILTIELFGSKDYMEDIINSVEFLKQNNIA